jgi:hypothetical protein
MLQFIFQVLLETFFDSLFDGGVRKRRDLDAPKDPSSDPADEESFRKFVEDNPRFSDPVYQKNLQRLIERNREFEEARK